MSFLDGLFANRRQKSPSREQWFAKIENLERLREILTDPVFVAASNYALDVRRLNESVLRAEPQALCTAAAFVAGHAAFLTDLERLAVAPVERFVEPQPFEWINGDS